MRLKTTTEILNQDFENIPQIEGEKRDIKSLRKPIFIFTGIFGSLLIILLATAILFGFQQGKETPEATPTPTSTPTLEFKEEISSLSPYATDSAILKLEEEIRALDQELFSTDLKESGLNPPSLEMKVNFEK